MIIRINYLNNLHEEIIKENAYVTGLNIRMNADQSSLQNLEERQINDHCITMEKFLPNGMSVKFLIIEIPETMSKKYNNFQTLFASFEGVNIEATI